MDSGRNDGMDHGVTVTVDIVQRDCDGGHAKRLSRHNQVSLRNPVDPPSESLSQHMRSEARVILNTGATKSAMNDSVDLAPVKRL
jgi:hypothetical protein